MSHTDEVLEVPRLPHWKPTDPWTVAPPPRGERCEITQHTAVRVEYGPLGSGSLHVYLSSSKPMWPKDGDDAQQRLATLEFAVAEMERALPIVREMIAQMKGAP